MLSLLCRISTSGPPSRTGQGFDTKGKNKGSCERKEGEVERKRGNTRKTRSTREKNDLIRIALPEKIFYNGSPWSKGKCIREKLL